MEAAFLTNNVPELNLPEHLEDFYDFYLAKIQADLALEKIMVEHLESVAMLDSFACTI